MRTASLYEDRSRWKGRSYTYCKSCSDTRETHRYLKYEDIHVDIHFDKKYSNWNDTSRKNKWKSHLQYWYQRRDFNLFQSSVTKNLKNIRSVYGPFIKIFVRSHESRPRETRSWVDLFILSSNVSVTMNMTTKDDRETIVVSCRVSHLNWTDHFTV